jgi:hypothetical protein
MLANVNAALFQNFTLKILYEGRIKGATCQASQAPRGHDRFPVVFTLHKKISTHFSIK